MSESKQKTVRALLTKVSATVAGIEDARLSAEWLVADVVGLPRLELPFHYDEPVDDAARHAIEQMAERMAGGEPIQYVLGHTDFMGFRILTDPRALIPRPETEELVEKVIRESDLGERERPVVADVGTGTGCIAIALAEWQPAIKVWALDQSSSALALARKNVAEHGLAERVSLVESDLLAALPPPKVDAIVSNPPYIPDDDYRALPLHIRDHEPELALAAGPEGLSVYERLAPEAYDRLVPGGWLFLEIGAEQADAVKALVEGAGFSEVMVHLDLSGRDRIVQARRG